MSITVLGVKGTQVKVGINAPKTLPVHREEIYRRIQRELSRSGRVNPAKAIRGLVNMEEDDFDEFVDTVQEVTNRGISIAWTPAGSDDVSIQTPVDDDEAKLIEDIASHMGISIISWAY